MTSRVAAYADREMRDRCTVERNQASTGDPYGGEGSPDWQIHLTDQRCKLWIQSGGEAVSENRIALVEDWKLNLPLGTDIAEGDRITSVVDFRGNVVTTDTLYVDFVANKRDQLVCSLERRG